jgi:hypothetical protein
MTVDGHRMGYYGCAHDWPLKYELPIGDPITGKVWTKDKPDIGTYEGGDFDDDLPTAMNASLYKKF